MSDNNVTAKKDFLAQCTVCKAKLLNWSGSTPCCGALADIIWEGIFPATPPTVAEKKEVSEQIEEMGKTLDREWIKAINNKTAAIKAKEMDDAIYWDARMSRIQNCIVALKLLLALPLPPTQPTEEKIGKGEGGE